jgi:hypothetical protein
MGMIDWINNNSDGSVDVKFAHENKSQMVYFAFENDDDATYFKIKYNI